MGWTSYHANYYKNGTVDRKRECDNYFDKGNCKILKSTMVGSTYYAAVKNGEEVFAAVFLTSTDSKDYFNFSIKTMDETMGPCQTDCPISILKLLTSTDNDFALEWREKCYKANELKKNGLNKLAIGTKIEIILPFDTVLYKKGEKVILTKEENYWTNRKYWRSDRAKFTNSLMKELELAKCYTVIEP